MSIKHCFLLMCKQGLIPDTRYRKPGASNVSTGSDLSCNERYTVKQIIRIFRMLIPFEGYKIKSAVRATDLEYENIFV